MYKDMYEHPIQGISTALDIETHWDLRNPLNIIPALILLAMLICIGSLIMSLI